MVKLCQLFPQIEKAKELAQEFTRIVRERSATQSKLKEFVSYARGWK